MQKITTDNTATRVSAVAASWGKLRPGKKFYGLTLEEYQQRTKPYTDALAEVAALEEALAHAKAIRDLAARPAMKITKYIVNAVKGDPEEGEDGPLYAAMGYVPESQRSTGLVRRKKANGGAGAVSGGEQSG
jgi:hypothetical protein